MKTLTTCLVIAVAGLTLGVKPVIAASATEALSKCIAESTSGKDRKELGQWFFVAMSIHPDIQPYTNVTASQRDALDQKMAALVTKLMIEDCKAETKAAAAEANAIEAAFGSLGRLASQELMSNPEVNASFFRYLNYIDHSRFDSAFTR